ncbi:GyrI-like domain-containing protein [Pseudonocardia sp.]|uniref:GyrI-like domain-containing protein n=1 Tax=Pseudonocardia sp. TaxID=60912 RepID=UPI0031FD572F
MEPATTTTDTINTAPITAGPALVDLPTRDVLSVDGRGAPEDQAFVTAIRALFAVRLGLGAGEGVPLEGSYSQGGSLESDDGPAFDLTSPDGWVWRLVVPAPPGMTAYGIAAAAARSGAPVQLRRQAEQRVAQVLHRGPYADEGPSLAALYAFVAEQGLGATGPHTEIYLDDPASTAPAVRTVLQVPVTPGSRQS